MIRRPLPIHRRLQMQSAWRRRQAEAERARLTAQSREIERINAQRREVIG